MKLHHIGIVCNESDIKKFYFKPKKKYVYNDDFQNNKLIIERDHLNSLWMVLYQKLYSTVYKFPSKRRKAFIIMRPIILKVRKKNY